MHNIERVIEDVLGCVPTRYRELEGGWRGGDSSLYIVQNKSVSCQHGDHVNDIWRGNVLGNILNGTYRL